MFPRPPTINDYYLFAPGKPDDRPRPRDGAAAAEPPRPGAIGPQIRAALSLLAGMTGMGGASFFALLLLAGAISHDRPAVAGAAPVDTGASDKPRPR